MALLGEGIIITGSYTTSILFDDICIVQTYNRDTNFAPISFSQDQTSEFGILQNYELFDICNIISGSANDILGFDQTIVYQNNQVAFGNITKIKIYEKPEIVFQSDTIIKESV